MYFTKKYIYMFKIICYKTNKFLRQGNILSCGITFTFNILITLDL